MSSLQIPAVEDFLPDWSVSRVLILDRSERWTAAIAAQVSDRLRDAGNDVPESRGIVFDAFTSTRDLSRAAQQNSSTALIIFLAGVERDCLTLLRRLVTAPHCPPILIVAAEQHQELMPLLLESGVDSLLFGVVNDVPIADWCLQLLAVNAQQTRRQISE